MLPFGRSLREETGQFTFTHIRSRLRVIGAFAGLVFMGAVGYGNNWYVDSNSGWFGGHWWWIAVTAAAGVVVGLLRRLMRRPEEPPARPRPVTGRRGPPGRAPWCGPGRMAAIG